MLLTDYLCLISNRDIVGWYRKSCDQLYTKHNKEMSKMIDAAGECLLSNSHVIYAGADAAGILTMVDASECVATFGSGIFRLLPFINT